MSRWVGQTWSRLGATRRRGSAERATGRWLRRHELQAPVQRRWRGWKTIATSSATTTHRSDRKLKTATHIGSARPRHRRSRQRQPRTPLVLADFRPVLRSASARVTYLGAWKKTKSPKALWRRARHATASTKRAHVPTSRGYDVRLDRHREPASSGKARIFIDGTLIGTVDLDRASTALPQSWSRPPLRHASPTHDLEIQPVGDGRVDIDGFVVPR